MGRDLRRYYVLQNELYDCTTVCCYLITAWDWPCKSSIKYSPWIFNNTMFLPWFSGTSPCYMPILNSWCREFYPRNAVKNECPWIYPYSTIHLPLSLDNRLTKSNKFGSKMILMSFLIHIYRPSTHPWMTYRPLGPILSYYFALLILLLMACIAHLYFHL